MNPFSDFHSSDNFNLFNILSRFRKKSNITKLKALQDFEDNIANFDISQNALEIKDALQPLLKQDDNDLKIRSCEVFIKIHKKNIKIFKEVVPEIILILLENNKESAIEEDKVGVKGLVTDKDIVHENRGGKVGDDKGDDYTRLESNGIQKIDKSTQSASIERVNDRLDAILRLANDPIQNNDTSADKGERKCDNDKLNDPASLANDPIQNSDTSADMNGRKCDNYKLNDPGSLAKDTIQNSDKTLEKAIQCAGKKYKYRAFLNEIHNYRSEVLNLISYKKSKASYFKIILLFTKNKFDVERIESLVLCDLNNYNFDDISDVIFTSKILLLEKENKKITEKFLPKVKNIANKICIDKKWEILVNVYDIYDKEMFLKDYKHISELNMIKIIENVYNSNIKIEMKEKGIKGSMLSKDYDKDAFFSSLDIKKLPIFYSILRNAKDKKAILKKFIDSKNQESNLLNFNALNFCDDFKFLNANCDYQKINKMLKYIQAKDEWYDFDKFETLQGLNEREKIIRCSLLNLKTETTMSIEEISDIFLDALNVLPKEYYSEYVKSTNSPSDLLLHVLVKYPDLIDNQNINLFFNDNLKLIINHVTCANLQTKIHKHIQDNFTVKDFLDVYNFTEIPEFLSELFYVNLSDKITYKNVKLSASKMLNCYFNKNIVEKAIKNKHLDLAQVICEVFTILCNLKIQNSVVYDDSFYYLNSYFYTDIAELPFNNEVYEFLLSIAEIFENVLDLEELFVTGNIAVDDTKNLYTSVLSCALEDKTIIKNLALLLSYLIYEVLNIKYEIHKNFKISSGLLCTLESVNHKLLYFVFAVLTKSQIKFLLTFNEVQEFYYACKKKNSDFLLEYYENQEQSKVTQSIGNTNTKVELKRDQKGDAEMVKENPGVTSSDERDNFKEYQSAFFDLANDREINFTNLNTSNNRILNLIIRNIQKINTTIIFTNERYKIRFYSNFIPNNEKAYINLNEDFMRFLDNESVENILAILALNSHEFKIEADDCMASPAILSSYGDLHLYNSNFSGSFANLQSFQAFVLQFCENDFVWEYETKFYTNRSKLFNACLNNVYTSIADSIANNYSLTRFEIDASESEIFDVLVEIVDFKRNFAKKNNRFFWNVFLQSVNLLRNIEILFLLERSIKKLDLTFLQKLNNEYVLSLFIFNFPNIDLQTLKASKGKAGKIQAYRSFDCVKYTENQSCSTVIDDSLLLSHVSKFIQKESNKKIAGLKTGLRKINNLFVLKIVHSFEDSEFLVRIEIDPRNIKATKFKSNLFENDLITKKIESLLKRSRKYMDILSIWKVNVEKKLEGIKECYICYYAVEEGDKSFPDFKCSNCSNKFHKKCLGKWLEKRKDNNCPLCRKKV